MTNFNPKFTWRYCTFNFVLLALLFAWLWCQNQAIKLPEPNLAPDAKLQCVSYSPYYQPGDTPLDPNTFISPEQIDRDLAALSKQFACVRIYSVSQGLDYVPEAASKLGMKVYLGAWIGWVKALNDKELNLAIAVANKHPETIKALVVGNEVLLRGEQSEKMMKSYIERAKASTKVPVTYADVWEYWRKHPKLEESVDFVTVHILPYWEDKPKPIDIAVSHTANIMNLLGKTFHKPILIGETGWPSIGRQRQGALPSVTNQARYMRGFLQTAQQKNWNYNLIEAFDQPWKRGLEGTVGGYWGILNANFSLKFPLSGNFAERHDGLKPMIAAVLGALLLTLIGLYFKAQNKVLNKQTWLGLVSLGALVGLSTLLQSEYLLAACRTQQEWMTLGGIAALGAVTLLGIASFAINATHKTKTIIQLSALAFLLAALTANFLLITDGRYRDFAIALYLLPALQMAWGVRLLGAKLNPNKSVFKLLATLLLLSALACLYLEPSNQLAWAWLFINALLASANWPQKSTLA